MQDHLFPQEDVPEVRISHVLFEKVCCLINVWLLRPSFSPFPKRGAEYRYKNATFANLFNLLSFDSSPWFSYAKDTFLRHLDLHPWCIFLIPAMAAKHGGRRSYSRREQWIFTLCLVQITGCQQSWTPDPQLAPAFLLDILHGERESQLSSHLGTYIGLCGSKALLLKDRVLFGGREKLQTWKVYKMVFHVFHL